MSAGLAASTVTPGSTAPVVSFTTPAMAPVVADWAHADAAAKQAQPSRATVLKDLITPFFPSRPPQQAVRGRHETPRAAWIIGMPLGANNSPMGGFRPLPRSYNHARMARIRRRLRL